MDIYAAAELAYNNGKEAGLKEASKIKQNDKPTWIDIYTKYKVAFLYIYNYEVPDYDDYLTDEGQEFFEAPGDKLLEVLSKEMTDQDISGMSIEKDKDGYDICFRFEMFDPTTGKSGIDTFMIKEIKGDK